MIRIKTLTANEIQIGQRIEIPNMGYFDVLDIKMMDTQVRLISHDDYIFLGASDMVYLIENYATLDCAHVEGEYCENCIPF